MASGEVEIEPYYSMVQPEICSGCRSCVQLCPYDAISFDETTNTADINAIKCKGCGVCVASCPSNAIIQNHFTRNQILSEIRALRPWESIKTIGDD